MDKNLNCPDLTIPLVLGTHSQPWDMRELLYLGAADLNRTKVQEFIKNNGNKNFRARRLPMVCAFHEVILAKHVVNSKITVIKYLEGLWRFYAWCDGVNEDVTIETVIHLYRWYAEELWHKLNINREISEGCAYALARQMADLIVRATKRSEYESGRDLLSRTRITAPSRSKFALGSEAEKRNPTEINKFGRVITCIARSLDIPTIRGRLPINITLESGQQLLVKGGLKDMDVGWQSSEIALARHRIRFAERRNALTDDIALTDVPGRISILNLKIDAELLIFIAQTGMPKQQAGMLQREEYRWRKSGDGFDVYRVFKGRRHGDALFHCYGKYRNHFEEYVEWLDDSGLSNVSDRLFPRLHNGMIPAADRAPSLESIKQLLARHNIRGYSTTDLRVHANNWLIRNNLPAKDVAIRGSHALSTNLRHYSKPNHQEAAVQISRFFKGIDPSITSPVGASCERNDAGPAPIPEVDRGTIEVDCVSPEGCLFCIHHRDILSADYCWKLASHARLKSLELGLNKISSKDVEHPAEKAIARINLKLAKICDEIDEGVDWVAAARDSIRAGRYHPLWKGAILLAELL
jgi:hypothetical protein